MTCVVCSVCLFVYLLLLLFFFFLGGGYSLNPCSKRSSDPLYMISLRPDFFPNSSHTSPVTALYTDYSVQFTVVPLSSCVETSSSPISFIYLLHVYRVQDMHAQISHQLDTGATSGGCDLSSGVMLSAQLHVLCLQALRSSGAEN